jgi:hypothetical protein
LDRPGTAKLFSDIDGSENLFEPVLKMDAARMSKKSNKALMNGSQAEREADRAQANREELTERIAQAIRQDGKVEPLKGLHFNRISLPAAPCHK